MSKRAVKNVQICTIAAVFFSFFLAKGLGTIRDEGIQKSCTDTRALTFGLRGRNRFPPERWPKPAGGQDFKAFKATERREEEEKKRLTVTYLIHATTLFKFINLQTVALLTVFLRPRQDWRCECWLLSDDWCPAGKSTAWDKDRHIKRRRAAGLRTMSDSSDPRSRQTTNRKKLSQYFPHNLLESLELFRDRKPWTGHAAVFFCLLDSLCDTSDSLILCWWVLGHWFSVGVHFEWTRRCDELLCEGLPHR